MANQIVVSAGAKVRNLSGVLTATSGVVSFLPIDVSLGIPQLDVNGKILVSQLPNSVMEYKGTWDASTNTPTLANGTGNQGDVYLCNVAGTVNFGAGAIAFVVGDSVIYSGSIWQRASGATGTVTSVAVTETGDSLNITGSPITTSGTINIGFNGTNLQYVNGAGNLTTFPTLTGYVPYTGATQDVDLGAFKLNAQSLHIKGTAGNGHLGLKHQSASATASANEVSLFADSLGDLGWQNGNLYLSKFITSGNTAARSYTFPNATCNIPDDSLVVHLAGTETITGAKTFSGGVTFSSSVTTNNLTFANSGFFLTLQPPTLSVNRTVTLPNATGTLALTSDIPSIAGLVPYTGATNSVNLGAYLLTASSVDSVGYTARGSGTLSGYIILKQGTTYLGNVVGYNSINANARKYVFISDVDGTNYKSAIFELSSLTNNTDRTYTLPDATGTIALVGGAGVGTVTSVAALTIGTSGTDLSSSVATSTTTPVITLNVPTASATNRGALSSADWTTFNNKQSTITLTTTGTSGAATFSSNTLNIPQYQGVLSNPVTGTGTTNYLPKFTGASTIGNSLVYDNGTNVGIGTTTINNPFGPTIAVQIGTYSGFNLLTIAGSTQSSICFSNSASGTGRYKGYIEYTYADDIMYFAVAADERMRITSTVIKTASSVSLEVGYSAIQGLYKLDVNGTGRFSGDLTLSSGGDRIFSINDTGGSLFQIQAASNILYYSARSTGGSLAFRTNGTNDVKLTIASTGAATFSSSVTATSFSISNGSISNNGYWGMLNTAGTGSYADWALINSGTTRIMHNPTGTLNMVFNGNVGIGTTSPNEKLDVNGAIQFRGDTQGYSNTTSVGMVDFYSGIARMLSFGADGSTYGGFDFYQAKQNNSGGRSAMRITSGGSVLIGTTTDYSSKLVVIPSSNPTSSTGSNNQISIGETSNNTGYCLKVGYINTGGGYQGSIQSIAGGSGSTLFLNASGGNVLIGTTTDGGTHKLQVNGSIIATGFFESSDSRLKTLIQDNYQTKGIASITPKLYTKNGKVELGYYAQDFVGILDSAVSKGSDDMLSLSYREVLVAKVYALEQRIKELENK